LIAPFSVEGGMNGVIRIKSPGLGSSAHISGDE
jgi:hypothetical protein